MHASPLHEEYILFAFSFFANKQKVKLSEKWGNNLSQRFIFNMMKLLIVNECLKGFLIYNIHKIHLIRHLWLYFPSLSLFYDFFFHEIFFFDIYIFVFQQINQRCSSHLHLLSVLWCCKLIDMQCGDSEWSSFIYERQKQSISLYMRALLQIFIQMVPITWYNKLILRKINTNHG